MKHYLNYFMLAVFTVGVVAFFYSLLNDEKNIAINKENKLGYSNKDVLARKTDLDKQENSILINKNLPKYTVNKVDTDDEVLLEMKKIENEINNSYIIHENEIATVDVQVEFEKKELDTTETEVMSLDKELKHYDTKLVALITEDENFQKSKIFDDKEQFENLDLVEIDNEDNLDENLINKLNEE
jgi:hypothetical protein